MNLGQIRTSIQALGYDTDTAAQQTEAINTCARTIYGSRRWWFLEKQSTSLATVVGTSTVDHVAGIADLRSANDVDAVRIQLGANPSPSNAFDLTFLPSQEFRSNEHLYRDTGVPEYWTVMNQLLHFYPYPDQAYTIVVDYIYKPADLVADGDTPPIPAVYHDVLKWGAIPLITFRERDPYHYQIAKGEYEQVHSAMVKEQNSIRQRQSSRFVGRSGLYDATLYPRGF